MNPHASTQKKEGRGPVGKQAVVGMESRKKTHVKAQVVSTARATTLHHVMNETTEKRVDVSGVDGVTSPVFSHREAGVQFYHADCLKLMGVSDRTVSERGLRHDFCRPTLFPLERRYFLSCGETGVRQ